MERENAKEGSLENSATPKAQIIPMTYAVREQNRAEAKDIELKRDIEELERQGSGERKGLAEGKLEESEEGNCVCSAFACVERNKAFRQRWLWPVIESTKSSTG
ncbi:hypothetical protein BC835DRAFT_1302527 [Cytidiella melzeri]|nr:hypothetical protein BC835DRAFT_1302527 [Cytidiella melzeri]